MCFDRLIHVLELFMSLFKDRLKAFEKFKNKKKVYEAIFFGM